MVKLFSTAELVVFVANGGLNDKSMDDVGHSALKLFKSIGVTSHVIAIQCPTANNMKEASAIKKHVLADVSSHVGEGVKAFLTNSEDDVRSMLLHLQPDTVSIPHWRRQRPSLFVHDCSVQQSSTGHCSVSLEGYVRHASLSANQIITLPGFQDFAIERITVIDGNLRMESDQSDQMVVYPDVDQQDSLVKENAFVPEEEIPSVEEPMDDAMQSMTRRVPKGTSDYQAAWIPDEASVTETENESESEGMQSVASGDIDDFREARSVGNAVSIESDSDDVSWDGMEMDDGAQQEDIDEKRYPDEVKSPVDQPARVRFQRYRGLKSFRTSPWDAKADLPQAYSHIFEFDSFAHAAKKANRERTQKNSVPVHAYISLVLKDVPEEIAGKMVDDVVRFRQGKAGPLVAVGLKQHEVKMSVLHYRVTKASDYKDPVGNKEKFLFVSGFRWFETAPLFSTDSPRYDKHRMEQSLEQGCHSIASTYGQISFPPMPLLAFKRLSDGHLRLAFSGTLLSCTPERVILKRIILTGRIHKAFKKRAVVGGMFHNPEDVRWFKPLELWTRDGRTGYIKESLGTKGLMKCTFDGNIKHSDTVCISLYKRVFPIWHKE